MGLFDKIRGSKESEEVILDATPVESTPKSKKKRKDKGEGLSSVLQETVTSTALAEFRNVGLLEVTRDGAPWYVGMFLETENIGGLSKNAAKKDSDKGSIIEQIKAGHIKVLITEPLMQDNAMVIIPDKSTLEHMGEYILLRNAPYQSMFVSADGQVIDLEGAVDITFDDMERVVNGATTITDLLEDKGVYWLVDKSAGVPGTQMADNSMQATQALPRIDTGLPGEFDDIPMEDDFEDSVYMMDDDNPFAADDESTLGSFDLVEEDYSEPVVPVQETAVVDIPVPSVQPQTEDNGVQPVAAVVPTSRNQEAALDAYYVRDIDPMNPDMFQKYLTRKFYSEDIGLEISAEPFDTYFMQDNPVILFDDQREDGWINSYLNEMSHVANVELMRLHSENLSTLRTRYFRLMGLYIDRMARDLDMDSMNTNCGKLVALATSDSSNKDATRHSRAEAEQKRIRDEFEKRVEEVGETGRRKAIDAFRSTHERNVEKDISRVYEKLSEQDEAEYRANIEYAKKINREEAAKRLDYGITKILGIIAQQYREMLEGEDKLYQKYRRKIQEFLDENRKDDIAYINVLEEEQRQADKAESVRMEYVEKLKAMEVDYDSRREQYERDLKEIEEKYKQRLSTMQSDSDARVEEYKRKNELLQAQLDDYMDKYATLDQQKDAEYKRTIAELKDEKSAADARIDDLASQHKRSSWMSIGLAVAVAICALLVGVVIGFSQKIDTTIPATTVTPAVQQLEVSDIVQYDDFIVIDV